MLSVSKERLVDRSETEFKNGGNSTKIAQSAVQLVGKIGVRQYHELVDGHDWITPGVCDVLVVHIHQISVERELMIDIK